MSAVALLIVCPLLGMMAARWHWLPPGSQATINAWVLRIALPALVLSQIPRIALDTSMLAPALAPWVVMIGALLLIPLVGAILKWDRRTIGAITLTCGLGNTAFVGLPLLSALVGPHAIPAAVMADQLGSFLAFCTIGLLVAAFYAGARLRPGDIFWRIVKFPPFAALVVALLVRPLGGWPTWASSAMEGLAQTLTPLALFAVGMQFRLGALGDHLAPLAVAIAWKLLLAPLIFLGLAWSQGWNGLPMQIGVLQAGMGPMITAGILAQDHHLNPALANLVVTIGVTLSFVSVPLWWWMLN